VAEGDEVCAKIAESLAVTGASIEEAGQAVGPSGRSWTHGHNYNRKLC